MKSPCSAGVPALRRDVASHADLAAAHRRLVGDSLGQEVLPGAWPDSWTPIAFFAPAARCVAALEVGLVQLVLDGERTSAAALRSVVTHPDWRGRGLFKALMAAALDWCDARPSAATLLYTATPALYARFGFAPLPQHAFVGAAPAAPQRRDVRRLDLSAGDHALVRRLVARRSPVSGRCALLADPALFVANVAGDEGLRLAYGADADTLVVFETQEDTLVIADAVAPRMPDIATLVAITGVTAARVKCLFPPDRIGWRGEAVPEDAGLMIRGALPAAMRAPFMFAPTGEF